MASTTAHVSEVPRIFEELDEQHNQPVHPESPRVIPEELDQTTESEKREALQYWGDLIRPDKCGTEKLDRLLKGVAKYIVSFH